jgi:DNA invertase Pin-like site-specific DNA recombinase
MRRKLPHLSLLGVNLSLKRKPVADDGRDRNYIVYWGQLRKGDVLVVGKLDRLSRSLKDVLTLMEKIELTSAGFQSLTEAIDTTSAGGRMMMQIVGSFAEFERAMLRERTQNGLNAARKEGRVGGRRPKLKPHQEQEIVRLVSSAQKTAADAARLFSVHPATISRLLGRRK